MKKLMISLTVAILTVTSFASTASARTSSGPEKLHRKYDFEPELQFVVAPLFSGTFGVAGGLAGALVAEQVCQSEEFFGCLGEGIIGLSVGGAVGAISGSMLSLRFTGGQHATIETYGGALVGGLLGTVVGVPLALGGVSLGARNESAALITGGILAGGAAITIGTVVGYQLSYDMRAIKHVSVTPLITPEHTGLSFSGRF